MKWLSNGLKLPPVSRTRVRLRQPGFRSCDNMKFSLIPKGSFIRGNQIYIYIYPVLLNKGYFYFGKTTITQFKCCE